MKKDSVITNSIIVIVAFLVAFTAGYFLFGKSDAPSNEAQDESTPTEEQAKEPEEKEEPDAEELATEIPDEAEALSRNGCLGCHSVEAMGVKGGDIGPDLSIAYYEVKGKHGKDLDTFLQEPTSAVMATVIADNPLEDEEREQIIESLKKLSEGDVSTETTDDEADSKDNADQE